eukprot:NODE_1534_length_1382_cov_12.141035_g1275_i0.p1 GENE.NODE_1534_length_1382_cov_12.141035_g1275_i0~~NODE_1534_length_1382_cov_12.141035_g1275_i0.p1  ORF type:complete len:273 (-),score=16.46 NODE_1534_length_1382_cov_12.141035_g1275_i0:67-885(-)
MKLAWICEELEAVLLHMAVYKRIQGAIGADPKRVVVDALHLLKKIQNQGGQRGCRKARSSRPTLPGRLGTEPIMMGLQDFASTIRSWFSDGRGHNSIINDNALTVSFDLTKTSGRSDVPPSTVFNVEFSVVYLGLLQVSRAVKAALTRKFGGGTAAAVVTAKQDYVDETALLVAFEDPDAPTEDYDGFIREVNKGIYVEGVAEALQRGNQGLLDAGCWWDAPLTLGGTSMIVVHQKLEQGIYVEGVAEALQRGNRNVNLLLPLCFSPNVFNS